ncbi:transcriptional regulator [Ktedonosporobacter rubrisoli]|uniref:Transcriptional regulator n=1 Tax=Ktedonosporobacter rubrisoli TaxID=2509675 RepID=A0A4P6JYT1_KTERU|nr:helix-turn-helix domain-containing protein [Ktedonosporobacter rubrisoli]QBD80988.1 transcriptional regulator [Ktedonosporobacter rubrisoli]
MSPKDSSLLPEPPPTNQVPRRPPEVDKFVDSFLSTVCDTSRRYILELLALSDDDGPGAVPEMRSGDIARAIGLSAATTSEHLQQLLRAGLVLSRREGNTVYYRLCNHELVQAFQTLLVALDGAYETHSPRENLQ